MLMCGFNLNEGAMCAEMQKVADAADISVLFFQLVLIFGLRLDQNTFTS